MPNFVKHVTIKLMQSAIEILFIFPILLALTIYAYPNGQVLTVIAGLVGYYLVGILLSRFLRNKSNAIYVVISSIIGITASFIIGSFESFSVIYAIMASFSIFRGIRINKSNWMKQSPIPVFNLLLATYFVFNVLFLMSKSLYPYVGLLNIAGLFMIVVFLSLCSLDQLKGAFFKLGDKNHIPSTILKFNITSLIIILVLIIALSRFKPFWNSVIVLAKSVVLVIYSFFSNLSFNTNGNVQTDEIQMFGKKFSNNISILEVISNILRVAAIIGFAILTIYVIFKFIHKIAIWLSNKSEENIVKENTLGYVDEREILLKSPSNYWPNVKSFLHLFSKERSWKDLLTNRDKVRFIYRQKVLSFIKKGFGFKNSLTPNELAKELERVYKEDVSDLTSSYNKARYSCEDIEDIELEMLINRHKR
ncbi:hypothetical protein [Pseudobacteroides cellulosolvens]|uniref:DUF4129 domain-containing protein n=1 Tax=Pseudobacteroides cellulosolvens ATCC 35603 = DSM 2933 TaxID=398512 RepID=A0A0L6JTM1_9FIRM|nr:hypothetical protein [Pseudobacteroides cellulosolvens]KNY29168.1 hypothetical protein Bccel_4442 [Pseudobacteroides cellulosolvens ATCC 35603 = DSM 2933]